MYDLDYIAPAEGDRSWRNSVHMRIAKDNTRMRMLVCMTFMALLPRRRIREGRVEEREERECRARYRGCGRVYG